MADEPEEKPEEKVVQILVNVSWPADTYEDAEPTNVFIFNDIGENVCFAFGFAPPPPAPERFAEDGVINIEANRSRAFVVPKSMILNLRTELNRYIEENRQAFGLGDDSDAE
ncbi:hypothetical protein MMAN_04380 [Mycobacterium mantenii]|uniref:DUF3467 domain-containing protein n=1 Tax=Mycobacterium mantenii TaxID=560555 RepID=A0ABM7JN26_MYCNT|nr:hypothetical protein [Mycobacterium mantenii]MCV7241170.1 hypothetical protein [Mycobacterium mantenii]BBY36304.1 hypothetical protein MMAN_04380 [Mycobacterium mantenii]